MAANPPDVAPATRSPAIDLSPLAPPFRQRADLRLMALFVALLVLTQFRAHSAPSEDEWFAYVGPLILLFFSGSHAGSSLRVQSSRYAAGLLDRAKLPHTADNLQLARVIFQQRTSESSVSIAFSIASILGLWASFFYLFWGIRPFDISTWNTAFVSLLHLLGFVILLGAATVSGLAPTGLVVTKPLNFAELVDHASVSSLELDERDRNDIELVATGVALESLHRRVETYTIESTLLSALSFSAFTAIVYSESALEASRWLSEISWICANDLPMLCFPRLGVSEIQQHSMYITAACLLSCAVFFLAVLVTRHRFNDAFRYTEELLKTAQALDKKEESGAEAIRPQLTQEIARLLDRAKHGLADLQPMILFMKGFRELGIFAFVLAVASCGLLFHWIAAVATLVLLTSALLFGYVDKLRRKSNFLPRLQNTILSLGRQRAKQ